MKKIVFEWSRQSGLKDLGDVLLFKKIEDYLSLDHIDILYEDSVKANIQFFQEKKDNKKINFILDRLTKSFVTIEIKEDNRLCLIILNLEKLE